MTAAIAFNPYLTTNGAGSFNIQSDGGVQGLVMDDPSIRYQLDGGILADAETIPMWGGVAVKLTVPPATQNDALGAVVGRATAYANLLGFSCFNQLGSAVISTGSNVPLVGSKGQVNFFRLGSRARIWVQADASFAATLQNGLENVAVSWDFTNQKLVAFATTALPCELLKVSIGNSMIVNYNSGTNTATWTQGGAAVLIQI